MYQVRQVTNMAYILMFRLKNFRTRCHLSQRNEVTAGWRSRCRWAREPYN